MTALLLKDLKNQQSQWKSYLFILVIWGAISIHNRQYEFLGGWMVMLAIMVPLTAMAYDDRANWDRYALTMPFSRTDLVLSRYLLALFCLLVCGIPYLLLSAYFRAPLLETGLSWFVLFSVGMIINSFSLPLIFRFGIEKGRILMMVVILVPTALVMLIPDSLGQLFQQLDPSPLMLLWALPIAAGITALSILISLQIYRSKEF